MDPHGMSRGEQAHEALEDLAAGLVGMPTDEARRFCEDLGLTFRVVDWDVEKGPVFMNSAYRRDRISGEARGGVVTRAEAG